MNIKQKIKLLEDEIENPKNGLPYDIFLFFSRNIPLINVDLLIKNENNETLLVYREDEFYKGWHIPGGIIRFKETIEERIKKTALNELDCDIDFKKEPISVKELIHKDRNNRGHFISMLFSCKLRNLPNEKNRCLDIQNPIDKQWAWFKTTPKDLLEVHLVYKRFIEGVNCEKM